MPWVSKREKQTLLKRNREKLSLSYHNHHRSILQLHHKSITTTNLPISHTHKPHQKPPFLDTNGLNNKKIKEPSQETHGPLCLNFEGLRGSRLSNTFIWYLRVGWIYQLSIVGLGWVSGLPSQKLVIWVGLRFGVTVISSMRRGKILKKWVTMGSLWFCKKQICSLWGFQKWVFDEACGCMIGGRWLWSDVDGGFLGGWWWLWWSRRRARWWLW